MASWVGDWTWRHTTPKGRSANSLAGMAYDNDKPTDVRLCDHRHRRISQAEACGEQIAERMNYYPPDLR